VANPESGPDYSAITMKYVFQIYIPRKKSSRTPGWRPLFYITCVRMKRNTKSFKNVYTARNRIAQQDLIGNKHTRAVTSLCHSQLSVWKCLPCLLWHWNLLTQFSYGILGIYRIRGPIPRRSCPSHHQFYLLLKHERSEQLWHQRPLSVMYDILSLTNLTLLTADMALLVK
jgi:hypothetical protein